MITKVLRGDLWLRALAALLLFGCVAGSALAEELKLKAQLVWGTDEAKPKDDKLKDLDEALRKKLGRIFKWKNYFQVSEQTLTLQAKELKRLKMSHKCELEVKYSDDAMLEVKLFGEGRLTKTMRISGKALRAGELGVLGGDDKEKYNDAWFVVLSCPSH